MADLSKSLNNLNVFDAGGGVFFYASPNEKASAVMSVISGNIALNDKPVYLSLLMDKTQLQTIIDNNHLFDEHTVNAASLLLLGYNTMKLEYTE